MLRHVFVFAALVLTSCQYEQARGIAQPTSVERDVPSTLLPYVNVAADRVLLTNITIISGDGETIFHDQWLLVSGAEIEAVGPMSDAPSSNGIIVLDLEGHTVIPGLIGMHNHLHMPGNPLLNYSAPRLYLAGGVTTIATAGAANPLGEASLARRINAGEEPGPTIFLSAPYVTGLGGNAPMDKPQSREEVESFVSAWASRGVTWFKIYRHTDPDIAAILIDAAHTHGIKVTGHLCSISYSEAAQMGIDSLEHGISAASDFVVDRQKGECKPTWASLTEIDVNGNAMSELVSVLVENDVTITSTLAILETSFAHRHQGDARSLAALSTSRVEAYEARQTQLAANATTSVATPELWDIFTEFERRFVAAGGRLVAGPDTGSKEISSCWSKPVFQSPKWSAS